MDESFAVPTENAYVRPAGYFMAVEPVNFASDWPKMLDSKYDNFFKAVVTAEWCVKSDGNVEAPSGFFALVEVPSHQGEYQQMVEAVFDEPRTVSWADYMRDHYPEMPAPGWYVTTELSTGIIVVMEYPLQIAADKAYRELFDAYAMWDQS